MPRPVFLIVYKSPLFPANWAFVVPSLSRTERGNIIHATGDVQNGFEYEFKKGYSLEEDSRKSVLVPLGEVEYAMVVDGVEDQEEVIETGEDCKAADRMEEIALSVPTPGKTLNTVSETAGSRAAVAKQENCQNWFMSFVEKLVAEKVLGAEAVEAVRGAPKN